MVLATRRSHDVYLLAVLMMSGLCTFERDFCYRESPGKPFASGRFGVLSVVPARNECPRKRWKQELLSAVFASRSVCLLLG